MGRPREDETAATDSGYVMERGRVAVRTLLEYRAGWADSPPAKAAEVAEIMQPYREAHRVAFHAAARRGSPDPAAEVKKAEAAIKAVAELDDLLGPPRLHKVALGRAAT